MDSKKAELLGLLCSEGSHYKYVSGYWGWSRNPARKHWKVQVKEGIEFNNQHPLLLEHFRSLSSFLYSYAPRVTGVAKSWKVKLVKKAVVQDILSHTAIGCQKWAVPTEVARGALQAKAAFVRGLYEGDGTKPYRRSRNCYQADFHMKNRRGLEEVQRLLFDLGVRSYINSEKSGMHRLIISGAQIRPFFEVINPRFKTIQFAEEPQR